VNQPIWNFAQEPGEEPLDATSISLRAYFDQMDDDKMQEYLPEWSDRQVVAWDGHFGDDALLAFAGWQRRVTVAEYRKVLEEAIEYRDRIRLMLRW